MTDRKKQLDAGNAYCRNNLEVLSREVLQWKTTGILPSDARLRTAAELFNFVGRDAMQMAEESVKSAAMRFVVYEFQVLQERISNLTSDRDEAWR